MRHLALILGFLLVLTSLDLGPRQSNGAVASELQPVGALLAGTEPLGRGMPLAEPDPTSGEDSLFCQACVATLIYLDTEIARNVGDYPQPDISCAPAEHPSRAPPFLT